MSASKNNPPIPNTLPLSSAKTMMSSLELIGLMSPDVSLTQRVAYDVQRAPVQPSPSSLGTGALTPTDNTRSPVSEKSHSGFMNVASMTVKPGSFMHFPKDNPTPDSMSKTEPIEELEPEHIDLSESDPEPMEDTPEESDKMEAEKSSCRDTSPTLSSRTATATASPSRSSSYTASRGSRSGSWTKSSSQSVQSQRSVHITILLYTIHTIEYLLPMRSTRHFSSWLLPTLYLYHTPNHFSEFPQVRVSILGK